MSQDAVLIVEDERAQREGLVHYLSKRGFAVHGVATGAEALQLLRERTYALMVTDLRLPDIDGLEVIRQARVLDAELCMLLMTAYASVDSAVDALRVGAHDYLLKPLILEDLERKVRSLLASRELRRENAELRRALQHSHVAHELVRESPQMKAVMKWVERAARTNAIVLIRGETGTGKEVVARSIHRASAGAEEPFLPVNLAAIPESLAESELFGHERGAFTGATDRRDGVMRAAGKGTVFLDEIAELPLAAQAKLLRALEAREVQPLGKDRAVPFEARVIAATHRDLEAMAADGSFREDLFYRLNVLPIVVAPLRERPEDIPWLVDDLLRRQSSGPGAGRPIITAEAMRALCGYAWRGNVRELANVVERANILADGDRIGVEELPADVRESADGLRLSEAVERFERSHIAMVLRLCNGNRDRAAEELGVSPATLYRRIEKLGLRGVEVHR